MILTSNCFRNIYILRFWPPIYLFFLGSRMYGSWSHPDLGIFQRKGPSVLQKLVSKSWKNTIIGVQPTFATILNNKIVFCKKICFYLKGCKLFSLSVIPLYFCKFLKFVIGRGEAFLTHILKWFFILTVIQSASSAHIHIHIYIKRIKWK